MIEAVSEEYLSAAAAVQNFTIALPYGYHVTYQYMCNNCVKYNKSLAIYHYLLCPSMVGWRKYHNLCIDIDELCVYEGQNKIIGLCNPDGFDTTLTMISKRKGKMCQK